MFGDAEQQSQPPRFEARWNHENQCVGVGPGTGPDARQVRAGEIGKARSHGAGGKYGVISEPLPETRVDQTRLEPCLAKRFLANQHLAVIHERIARALRAQHAVTRHGHGGIVELYGGKPHQGTCK